MDGILEMVESVLELAGRAVPVIEATTGQGEAAEAAIGAARAIVELIDRTREIASDDLDVVQLKTIRDEIEARVQAHAARTIDSLEGQG